MRPSVPIPVHRGLRFGLVGGLRYVCVLFLAGLFADLSFAPGPSIPAIGVPALAPAVLGAALVGGFAGALVSFGLRSPTVVVIVAAALAVPLEAVSLRPSITSVFGVWPVLAPVVVTIAGVEYGLRRGPVPSVRGSVHTERALLGGMLTGFLVLVVFSLRDVRPVVVLTAAGPRTSASPVASMLAAFGPPALLVWSSISLALRYGLVAPLVAVPAVGALLANPLGVAFLLFTAVSPLLFVVAGLAGGEYALRVRLSLFGPRSLVG